MTTISASMHVDAPTERVWEIVADLGAVATFHPYVTHSYYSSQAKAGPTPPIQNFLASIAVQRDGAGTLATITAQYQPKLGPLGRLLDQLMIRPQYEKMLPNILAGLKHYAETGEVVDGSFLKRLQVAEARA